MADAADLTKLVPGFEFLQDLVKNAGSSLPGIGQWVAPTLDPKELDKRIEELRTVQFWLEQNARMLAATIQALEVQRMTLSTLQTMNVQIGDLHETLKIRTPAAKSQAAETATPPAAQTGKKPAAATAAPAGVVDPMQWWSALTKQFTELASSAMKDSTTQAAKNFEASVGTPPAGNTTSTAGAATGTRRSAGAAQAKSTRKRGARGT
jgi:hypothetical protein